MGCDPLEKYIRKDMDVEHDMRAFSLIFLRYLCGVSPHFEFNMEKSQRWNYC